MMKSFLFASLFMTMTLCGFSQTLPLDALYWHGQERVLRYQPDGDGFVIVNGNKRFTRAIYGTNTGFRFETSDFPEFGLYMPNLGGSVYFALQAGNKVVWINEAQKIQSRFTPGCREYVVTDSRYLGTGSLKITALALSDADGFVIKMEPVNIPAGVKILTFFGGASNQRFSREGDLGADPFDSFFITSAKCQGNIFGIKNNVATLFYGAGVKVLSQDEAYENDATKSAVQVSIGEVAKTALQISVTFPAGSRLSTADARNIDQLDQLVSSKGGAAPILMAEYAVGKNPFYISLHNPKTLPVFKYSDLAAAFVSAEKFRQSINQRVHIETPDIFMNPLGGIFSSAENAVWQSPGYLHGAIGWRMPLTGWRAAYLADVFGFHDRARLHFNGYAKAQVTNVPVVLQPLQDALLNLARSAKIWGTPMYSNGYICRNPNQNNTMHHYDMNLCYIDELLWHLNWTGDMAYAKEIFPVIKRHLAWEKNTFDPQDDGLYDAYCCIWASDALQYNGGAVTHSSAYNYRANKMAAEIAEKLGEDPTPYRLESEKILNAINNQLWLKDKGWWAEYKDRMGYKKIHESAALWTVYHSIDSEINDAFQSYQATRYVDTKLPHVPVVAKGLPDEGNYMISTTDWVPYVWSINNVCFAEVMHTALAYWQTGRPEEAFKLFKGTVLDAMYLGSGPGNITQISYYDAARGETYRDFADPVAMGSRAMVQGMYGILPDLMNGKLLIRPGFPAAWDRASIKTQNMAYSFERKGDVETYVIEPKLARSASLALELSAPKDRVGSITVNGVAVRYTVKADAVGRPVIRIEAGEAAKYTVRVQWAGALVSKQPYECQAALGELLNINIQESVKQVYDPQGVLSNPVISGTKLSGKVQGVSGARTVFVQVSQGDMIWWKPLNIDSSPAVELLSDGSADRLEFTLVNHGNTPLVGGVYLNNLTSGLIQSVTLAPGAQQKITAGSPRAVFGTNRIWVKTAQKTLEFKAINWNITPASGASYRMVDMGKYFNDKLTNIFRYGKYLTPRYAFTTLQVPTQGVGNWCDPTELPRIDDSGLRNGAKAGNVFTGPKNIPFATPSDTSQKNILFSSLWDNYPNQVTLPLSGKASHAYFMVAGSTNHMQVYMTNGTIKVTYADGSSDILPLILPDNWLPIEQDVYVDGAAFRVREPQPFRIALKTARMSRTLLKDQGRATKAGPNMIDGGAATVIDMPLNPDKEMVSLELKSVASEVVLGIMSVTLVP